MISSSSFRSPRDRLMVSPGFRPCARAKRSPSMPSSRLSGRLPSRSRGTQTTLSPSLATSVRVGSSLSLGASKSAETRRCASLTPGMDKISRRVRSLISPRAHRSAMLLRRNWPSRSLSTLRQEASSPMYNITASEQMIRLARKDFHSCFRSRSSLTSSDGLAAFFFTTRYPPSAWGWN